MIDFQKYADWLWNARIQNQPCLALTDEASHFSLEAAYQVSLLNYKKRLALPGVRALGKKIGLTSLAVQKQLGVSEPDFGYLTSDMKVADQGTLPKGSLIQGRVEGEVAFVLKKDLRGDRITAEDVIHATDYVVACIEVIDSRVKDWKIKIQDTVADNASAAFFVLGNEKTRPSRPDNG